MVKKAKEVLMPNVKDFLKWWLIVQPSDGLWCLLRYKWCLEERWSAAPDLFSIKTS